MWTARFSQEPADQSVVLGERVVLSCVVFNYTGIVQWTKDGLALGVGEGLRGEDTHTHTRVLSCVHTRRHKHTCVQTQAAAHAYTCVHAHTHTHTDH